MRNLGKKFIVSILLGIFLWVTGVLPLHAEIRWEEGTTSHYLNSEEKYFYPHLDKLNTEQILAPVVVLTSESVKISQQTPTLKRYAMAGLVGKLSEQAYLTFFPSLLNPVSNTANFQKARADMPHFLDTFQIKTHRLAADFQSKDLKKGELYLADLKNSQEIEKYLSKLPKKVILLVVPNNLDDLVVEYNPYDRSGVFSSHSLRSIGIITPADLLNRFVSYFKLPALPLLSDSMAYSNIYYTAEPVTVTLDSTDLAFAQNDWQARLDFISRINLSHDQFQQVGVFLLAFLIAIALAIKFRKHLYLQLALFLLFPAGALAYRATHYLGLAGIYTAITMGAIALLLWGLLLLLEHYMHRLWPELSVYLAKHQLPPPSFLFTLLTLLSICFYNYYEDYSAPISFEKMVPFFESNKVFLALFVLLTFIFITLGIRFLSQLNQARKYQRYWRYLQILNALAAGLGLVYALRDLFFLLARDIFQVDIYALPLNLGLPLSSSYSALAISLFFLAVLLTLILLPLYFSARLRQYAPFSSRALARFSPDTSAPRNKRSFLAETLVVAVTVVLLALGSWGHFAGPGFSGSPQPSSASSTDTPVEAPASAALSGQPATADSAAPVAVVMATDLDWNELMLHSGLAQLVSDSSGFAFRSDMRLGQLPCPQDNWLVLSAGGSPWKYSIGGYMLCNKLGYQANDSATPLFSYYQDTISRTRYQPGTLGSQLKAKQISTAQVGKAAFLGAVQPDGSFYGDRYAQADPNQLGEIIGSHQLTLIEANLKENDYTHTRQDQALNAYSKVLRDTLYKAQKPAAAPSEWDWRWPLYESGKLSYQHYMVPDYYPYDGKWQAAAKLLTESAPEPLPYPNPLLKSVRTSFDFINSTASAEENYHFNKENAQYLSTVKFDTDQNRAWFTRLISDEQYQKMEHLYQILKQIPDGTRVMVVTTSNGKSLSVGFAYGPGIGSGLAYSPSLHHQGLAQTGDVLATTLRWLNIDTKPLNLAGAKLEFPSSNATAKATDSTGVSTDSTGAATDADTTKATAPVTATSAKTRGDSSTNNAAAPSAQVSTAAKPAAANAPEDAAKPESSAESETAADSESSADSEAAGEALPPVADWFYTLQNNSTRAEAVYLTGKDFYKTIATLFYLVAILGLILLALPVQKFLRRFNAQVFALALIRILFLLLLALPVGGIFASEVPWWVFPGSASFFQSFAVATAVLIVLCALAGPWKRLTWGSELFIMALTAIMFCLDLLSGSRIMQDSPIGFYTLYGGRYYGMGNESFALVSVAFICLITFIVYPRLHSEQLSQTRFKSARFRKIAFNLVLFTLGGIFILLDGAPNLGADFGGPLAFLPALLILFILVNELKVSWKKLVLIMGATGCFSFGLAFLDYLRPLEKRTHLGRLVQSMFDGELFPILVNKLNNNLKTLLYFNYVTATLVCIFVLFLLLSRLNSTGSYRGIVSEALPSKGLKQLPPRLQNFSERMWGYLRPGLAGAPLLGQNPIFKPTLISVSCCTVLAYLLNDSGMQLFGLAAYFFGSAFLSYLYQYIQDYKLADKLTFL